MNNKAELLKKLKALVDRGIDGEKVSAEKKLKELMRKYDISENELLEDKIATVAFKYHGKEQRRLLVQIIYKVTNCTDFYTYRSINSRRKSKTSLGADVTAAQKIEIEFLFDFYAKQYEKERSNFLEAFIQKHELFGELEPDVEPAEITFEQMAKLQGLMDSMEDVSPIRRLEGPEDEK
jgi:hypothetical protein|nr:MAG TPA_asm: Protein of unknown function (DUF2786) [Caudoviricetes sp.]